MKLKFDIDTHRNMEGEWVAQVLLAGVVVHQNTGPATESQAVGNATNSFAWLLRGAIEAQAEVEV